MLNVLSLDDRPSGSSKKASDNVDQGGSDGRSLLEQQLQEAIG
jgi:hypothetical protein